MEKFANSQHLHPAFALPFRRDDLFNRQTKGGGNLQRGRLFRKVAYCPYFFLNSSVKIFYFNINVNVEDLPVRLVRERGLSGRKTNND